MIQEHSFVYIDVLMICIIATWLCSIRDTNRQKSQHTEILQNIFP